MSKRTRLLSKLKYVYSHNTKLVLDVSNDDIGLIIEALETKNELNKRNMTADIIKEYMIFEDECVQKNFTFRSLIEAREKQIEKEIHKYANGTDHCPNCDYDNTALRFKVCVECGQRLDWSE